MITYNFRYLHESNVDAKLYLNPEASVAVAFGFQETWQLPGVQTESVILFNYFYRPLFN